jgi:hypothetical protein
MIFASIFATSRRPIRPDRKLGASARTVGGGVYEAAASPRLDAFDSTRR